MKAIKAFIHDSFFKEIFSKARHAVALFRLILIKEEFSLFDWPTLKLGATTFIDKQGREKRTDLQFSVYTKSSKEKITIVFLIEHKSYPDPRALLQMLGYQTGIYEQMMDNATLNTKNQKSKTNQKPTDQQSPQLKPEQKLAPVLPILVRQSKGPRGRWSVEFQDDLNWGHNPELRKRFGKNVVNFRPRVLNIPALDIKQMLSELGINPKSIDTKKEVKGLTSYLALFILKHIWDLDTKKVREFFVLSQGLDIEDRKFLVDKVAMYIQGYAPSFSWKILKEIEEEVIEDKEGRVMSLLEYTLEKERKKGWQKGQQEGWQKGIQKGVQQERKDLILKLLEGGLDVESVCKYTGFSKSELQKLKNSS